MSGDSLGGAPVRLRLVRMSTSGKLYQCDSAVVLVCWALCSQRKFISNLFEHHMADGEEEVKTDTEEEETEEEAAAE